MSNTLIPLLKVSLIQTFDFRRKNSSKNISLIAMLFIIILFGSCLSTIYAYMFTQFALNGEFDLVNVLYGMSGISALLSLFTAMPKVKDTLYASKDYDMLASLPIKKTNIIFVKLVSIYFRELIYSFIFLIPTTIVILVFGANPLYIIDGVLLFIFIPVIPLLVSGIFGLIISILADRFKFSNIISSVLSIAFVIGIMLMSSFLNFTEESEASFGPILAGIAWINPSTKLLNLDIVGVNYLVYVVVNVVVLAVICYVFALFYDKIHSYLQSSGSHRKYVVKDLKQKKQFKALFLMDFKKYASSRMYLVNTLTGGVLCIVMVLILVFSFNTDGLEMDMKVFYPFMVIAIVFSIGITTPSTSAISMEGKNFWIIKTLPINFKKFALSKILLSEIVLAPFALIASIILIVYSKTDVASNILIVLLPQVYLLGITVLGFYFNTIYYKLNWTSETEVVKNSKCVLVVMLASFAVDIVLAVLLFGIGLPFGFMYGAIAALAVTVIFTGLALMICIKKCSKNIKAIEI